MAEEIEKIPERIIWQNYPSWSQFSWLYVFALWTGMRGLLLLRLNVEGWKLWMGGVAILLGLVIALRYWAKYIVTTQRVLLKNGYSGKELESMEIRTIKKVELDQGPVAGFLGIGTVVVKEQGTDRSLRFRGVANPDVPMTKLQALLPVSPDVVNES
ncbi:MAG: PH domain-containing protein [Nitrospirales bacterium]|nr:PH domain-containing protein [Nitrospirales bacterium]